MALHGAGLPEKISPGEFEKCVFLKRFAIEKWITLRTVEIPAEWEVWESQSGETLLVDPTGVSHLIPEVLCGCYVPFLRYYDPQSNADRYYKLIIVD